MRILKIFIVFVLLQVSLFAAATFSTEVTAQILADKIQGNGITITNPVLTRGVLGGAQSQVATFDNGIAGANFEIDEGIVLTASTATEAFSTNDSGQKSLNPGATANEDANINNVPGLPLYDPDLTNSLTNVYKLFNQVVFEFDITLDANTKLLLVDYQFASDEYPEWVGSEYNDAFGFFISGGDLDQTYNIARVVDDSTIVTVATMKQYDTVNINNVNEGILGFHANPTDANITILSNSAFFIPNGGTNVDNGGVDPTAATIVSEFDGFTKSLHATIDNLTPGQTYHFKMAVADVADAAWDAGVFINKIIGVRVPEVCYDYDIRVGNDILVPSVDNEIKTTAFPGEQLNLGIVLQSLEGELDLEDINLSVLLSPNDNLLFTKGAISPDSINSYTDIPDSWVQKVPYAQIPIGEHLTSSGGIISANQTMFTKLTYDFNGSNNIDTRFDLTANLELTVNGVIIPRTIRSNGANPTLVRCPTQSGYNPIWMSLNIERHDSQDGPLAEKQVLYTQISNRPFDVDVVSYDPNNTSLPKDIENITLELELIDAGKYTESNQSIFTCKEPTSVGGGQFVHFESPARSRVEVPGFITQRAIQNAAFRLWYLVDGNSSIIKHACIDANDNTCFQTLYNTKIRDIIDTPPYLCQSSCNVGDCYPCLKNYFATPVCSRDNFAIRPASYSLALHDNDESNSSESIPSIMLGKNYDSPVSIALAAGYNYRLEGNATQFGNDKNASGYYASFATTAAPHLLSQFQFNSTKPSCADTDNKDVSVVFHRGQIQYTVDDAGSIDFDSLSQYNNKNVGDYLYHIEDHNWTIVDQQRYPFKTFPDVEDCHIASSSISESSDDKSGCYISSRSTVESTEYVDLPLRFHPYTFNLNGVNFRIPTTGDNFVYVNDINTTSLSELYMSAILRGDLVAAAKGGTRTSNFTSGCYASPVVFDINQSMSRNNIPLDKNNIYAEDLEDASLVKVRFQRQYLDSALNGNYQVENNDTNTSTALTIAKSEFLDENNGSATLRVHYNFIKPKKHVMNPITVRFNQREAYGPQEIFNAHMQEDYVATGAADINRTVDFYYGRIVSSQEVYQIPSDTDSVVVPLYIEAYCDNSIIDCSIHNLTLQSVRNPNSWWINEKHDSVRMDGLIANFNGLLNISTTPSTPINLNRNINKTDVNFTADTALTRPIRKKIEVVPDMPWLLYNPANVNNLADFILDYLGGGGWAGKGNTGLVVETNASANSIRKRLEW